MAVWRLAAAAACALALVACDAAPVAYPDQIAAWHEEKDHFMRSSPDMPTGALRVILLLRRFSREARPNVVLAIEPFLLSGRMLQRQ